MTLPVFTAVTVVNNRSNLNILPNSCLQVVIMRFLCLLNRHTLSFCLDDVQGASFVCDVSDISSQTFLLSTLYTCQRTLYMHVYQNPM